MCKSFFLILGSTYPKAWTNLPHSWGKLSHIPYFFFKTHYVFMARHVQFILLTQMCKYFLYHMQYSFSRIC